MNKLAEELNKTIQKNAPNVFEMFSSMGKELYFPKGILSQSAEAKQKATRYNATIGIAKEGTEAMHLPSVMKQFSGHLPNEVLPYAPSTGKPELRKKWREEIYRKNPGMEGKDISLPIVTSGITHGLSLAADLFIDKDDVVLLPDQAWGNYNMIFGVRHGANIVRYNFFSADDGFDIEGFRRYEGFFELPGLGQTVRLIGSAINGVDEIIPEGNIAVSVIEGNEEIDFKAIEMGTPNPVGGLEFTFLEESSFSGFQVSRDPANVLIWIASILFMLGICAVFYFPYRQVWVLTQPSSQGSSRLLIRIRGSRIFNSGSELNTLFKQLEKKLSKHPKNEKKGK